MGFDVQGYIRAVEQRDIEGMLSYLADDVEIWSEDEPQPIRGKETMRRFAQMAMPSMEEFQLRPERVIEDDRHVAMVVSVRAKYGEDLALPGWPRLNLRGKELRMKGAIFLDLDENGRVSRMHRFRDNLRVMEQLGITPQQLDQIRGALQQSGMTSETHA